MKKSLLLGMILMLAVIASGCTTYELYIDSERAAELEFYPLYDQEGGRSISFGDYSARIDSGFGFGLGVDNVLSVAGKTRSFSYTLYEKYIPIAEAEGEYTYSQASGSLFSGVLHIDATLKNRITGTIQFLGKDTRMCSVNLSMYEERSDREQIGTLECGDVSYAITARTALISESGRVWHRDTIQGYEVGIGGKLAAVVNTRFSDSYVAINTTLDEKQQAAAAAAASLLVFRSEIEF